MALQFLKSSWVHYDEKCIEGTLKTDVTAHFAKWCKSHNIEGNYTLTNNDFLIANPEWAVKRKNYCVECSSDHNDDPTRLKSHNKSCCVKGHRRRSAKERVTKLILQI